MILITPLSYCYSPNKAIIQRTKAQRKDLSCGFNLTFQIHWLLFFSSDHPLQLDGLPFLKIFILLHCYVVAQSCPSRFYSNFVFIKLPTTKQTHFSFLFTPKYKCPSYPKLMSQFWRQETDQGWSSSCATH